MTWRCLASLAYSWCVFVLITADGVQWSNVPQQGSSARHSTNQYYNSFSPFKGAHPFPNPSSNTRAPTPGPAGVCCPGSDSQKNIKWYVSPFFFFFMIPWILESERVTVKSLPGAQSEMDGKGFFWHKQTDTHARQMKTTSFQGSPLYGSLREFFCLKLEETEEGKQADSQPV